MSLAPVPVVNRTHEAQLASLAAALRDHPERIDRTGHTSFLARFAGPCERPVTITVLGRPTPLRGRHIVVDSRKSTPVPTWIDYEVPCRTCPRCLIQKQRLWEDRAQSEILRAQRTWMGTLTFSPERRSYYRNLAAVNVTARGEHFEALGNDGQFREVANLQGAACTLMLKRLRKNTQCHVRYLLVCEAHKSGDPHMHVLVHEVQGSAPVLKVHLEREWHEGFSQFRLVERAAGAARYVSKYLAKNPLTRVRASLRYGSGARPLPQKPGLSPLPEGKVNDHTQSDPSVGAVDQRNDQ